MLFPAKEVADLLVKLRRSFVEVVKLLQWIGRNHVIILSGDNLSKRPARG